MYMYMYVQVGTPTPIVRLKKRNQSHHQNWISEFRQRRKKLLIRRRNGEFIGGYPIPRYDDRTPSPHEVLLQARQTPHSRWYVSTSGSISISIISINSQGLILLRLFIRDLEMERALDFDFLFYLCEICSVRSCATLSQQTIQKCKISYHSTQSHSNKQLLPKLYSISTSNFCINYVIRFSKFGLCVSIYNYVPEFLELVAIG